MNESVIVRTSGEWEAEVGRQVRELRIALERTQEDLARDADVAVSTLRNLERGEGSSLRTVVQVVRALDREGWLGELSPPVSVRPMELLRERQRAKPRQRVRKRSG